MKGVQKDRKNKNNIFLYNAHSPYNINVKKFRNVPFTVL